MTDKKDNIVNFPQVVEVPTLWTDGEFGVVISNVKEVKVHDKELYIWFAKGSDDKRPWDIAIPYASHDDAMESYHMFMDMMRRMRFKLLNSELKKKV